MIGKFLDKKVATALAVTIVLLAMVCTVGASCLAYGFYEVQTETARSLDVRQSANGESTFAHCAEENSNEYLVEISYNNLLKRDGSLVRKLQIWVNKEALVAGLEGDALEAESGIIDFVLTSVKSTFITYGFTVNECDGYLEVPLEEYDSLTDLYIAAGYDGYEVDEEDDGETEMGLLFNTYKSKGGTPFASYSGSVIEMVVGTLTMIPNVNEKDVALVYNYGTKYSPKLLTSDADNIYFFSGEGVYIHKFVMGTKNTDRTFTMTQTSPNTVVWYAFALVVTIIIGAVFFVVAYKQRKKS